jgi:CRISPR/Cas system-associated exonuclease Cas4 (RecB family)
VQYLDYGRGARALPVKITEAEREEVESVFRESFCILTGFNKFSYLCLR